VFKEGVTTLVRARQNKKIRLGVIYSTFYDLDLMKESIDSVRPVADFIVNINQHTGFNGKSEPEINKELIPELQQMVNHWVTYTPKTGDKGEGMLAKLNIGLEILRNNSCTHCLIMSADERHKSNELLQDLERMIEIDARTVFHPIKAYYFDKQHYFIDTYYKASLYTIDDRNFERTTSDVLCDPLVRMRQDKYFISQNFMHHHTFLKDSYGNKLTNSVRALHKYDGMMQQIYDRLMTWKPGNNALVFSNDLERNGKVILKEFQLSEVPKPKLAICMVFWKRPEITEYTFKYYQQLKEKIADRIELQLIAC
jgi:hypothetical protein